MVETIQINHFDRNEIEIFTDEGIEVFITRRFLENEPDCIFVFGDNLKRIGKGGTAKFRDYPNTYGFVTKKAPCNNDDCFYIVDEYETEYEEQLEALYYYIIDNPNNPFLISKLGAGLANRFGIFEDVIKPNIKKDLGHLENVVFLW